MKVFPTRSCYHLMPTLGVQQGAATIKNFTDGELYVRIEEDVEKIPVAVLTATPAPAENLLELYFLLDALQRAGAHIHLFFTYFGYARQDRALKNEALSAEVIFRFLKTFNIQQTKIVHIHNAKVREFYDFQDIILLDFFTPLAGNVDCIIAPDKGAGYLAHEVARHTGKDCVVMTKKRSNHEKIAQTTINGSLKNKNVLLVDDMIATGGTIVHSANTAKEHGAQAVYVAATHGIFSGNAYATINNSIIDRVFVTNTLEQQHDHPKISVVDCAPMIDQFFW